MRRTIALAIIGVMLTAGATASAVGFAAGLSGSSATFGASRVGVPRCDPDGFTVLQNLSGANVVSVTVGGIAAGCGGGTIQVTLHNGSVSSSGSSTVPGGGGSLTIALASAVAATVSERVDVAVTGP